MNDDFDLDIDLGDADDDFFGGANDSSSGGSIFDDNDSQDYDASVNGFGADANDAQYQMPNGYDPQNGFNNNYSEDEDDGAAKRKALIIGAIGVIVILITVSVAGIFLKGNGKSKKVKQEPVVREEVQMPQNGSSTLSSTTSGNGWTEIDPDTSLKFSDPIEASFTPTNVRHYVKTTTTGEMEAKSVVTGSISGLTGTYELEIPYSQGRLLKRGQYFGITYRISEINGQQIVSDIIY